MILFLQFNNMSLLKEYIHYSYLLIEYIIKNEIFYFLHSKESYIITAFVGSVIDTFC